MRSLLLLPLLTAGLLFAKPDDEPLFPDKLDVNPPPLREDKSVKYDYDIVYTRMPRKGDTTLTVWPEIAHPLLLEPSTDLMLLHPDGTEEVLVPGGVDGAITDPVVSFDAKSVYFTHVRGLNGTNPHTQPPFGGADIYKLDLATGKKRLMTSQQFEPNTGAAKWGRNFREGGEGRTWFNHGVFNMGACPLPGGKLAFVSSKHGFRPPKHDSPTLQLFVMDEETGETDCIGHINMAMALHPVVLTDGRILFSSFESQGLRNGLLWGIWSIHPDGTNWAPVLSAFDPVNAPNLFHFQTQLSDGHIVVEQYYNHNNAGFGALWKLPAGPPEGYAPFGPAYRDDPRNTPLRFGRHDNAKGYFYKMGFTPHGAESLTRFANNEEGPAGLSDLKDPNSPAVGKFTHPWAAPDNHLLTIWSPGPVNTHITKKLPIVDGGIYLIKDGKPVDSPAQMRLVKNDPKYNEQFPRPVVPYERIYGVKEPKTLPVLKNEGSLSPHLPAGTPFGLVGSASVYKRESYPNGTVPKGKSTAVYAGAGDVSGYDGLDPFNTKENGASLNWYNQGADAGKYSNADIESIRIILMEPTTDRRQGERGGRLFRNHANERMRILGEVPVRKPGNPLDPDGNPDTSFLAKIPADTPFTFQTLDKHGMVLNASQTWHQLRPGEIRNDCGGCHAHSQRPTDFAKTYAARKEYQVADLTKNPPKDAEYFRDIAPILEKSCAACHTDKHGDPPAKLVLDDKKPIPIRHDFPVPGTYFRLAMDKEAKYGLPPLIGSWRQTNASRYVREFQSRRSLMVWKIFGQRMDGWTNDDFPTETTPGDPKTLMHKGKPVEPTDFNLNRADLDYTGSAMPPPDAVAGTWKAADGRTVKVEPLSDEDKRIIVRWIDLGCPIDLDWHPNRDPKGPRGLGWHCDDQRPIVTITEPRPGPNAKVERILIGLWDANSGLDMDSLKITADFAVNGRKSGMDLSPLFKQTETGVWELKLDAGLAKLERGEIVVSVRDNQGNAAKAERVFGVK